MAADLEKWGLNLDKIAYAIAGGLALIILCVPLFLAGSADESGLLAAYEKVKESIADAEEWAEKPQDLGTPLARVLERQWDPGAVSALDPAWVTERPPLLVKRTPDTPIAEPKHVPGSIAEISCLRDAEKKQPYLIVKGAPGVGNEHIVIQKAVLLRQAGEGGFKPVGEVDAKGEFAYSDFDVVPGGTYTYKLRTVAEVDPSIPKDAVKPIPPGGETQESEPLGPTQPVPWDYNLTVSSIFALTEGETPKFFGRFDYWDYQAGKYVGSRVQTQLLEKQRVGEKVGGGGRYEFLIVDESAKTVTVKDHGKTGASTTEKIPVSKVVRPVECWAPLVPGGSEPPPDEAVPDEAPAKAAPKATPKTTPKSTPKKTTEKTVPEKKTTTKKSGATDASGAGTKKKFR